MGTADFAVPILERIIDSNHKVVAVYTKAPTRKSRGLSIEKTPIHKVAELHKISILTPKTLRNQEELNIFLNIDADVVVVAAYGLIIPENFLNFCKFGCINIHPSDLPRWRGAAPIQRSMMAFDETTAICIMKMDSGIDTGPVFLKKHLELDKNKTINELTKEYAEIGAEMLIQTLKDLEDGRATLTEQSEDGITYANKITHEEGRINWKESADAIHGKVMALTPNAYFFHKDLQIKAIKSHVIPGRTSEIPGTVLNKNFEIACGDGSIIKIDKLQRPGGKVLDTKDFLCGYKIPVGTIIDPS